MMVTKIDILDKVPPLMAALTGLPVKSVRRAADVDLSVRLGPHLLAVEARLHARAGVVAQAAERTLVAAKRAKVPGIPLVAVPFMGEVGRKVCQQYGVSFVDLSGNADISAPGLRIHIAGKPNLFLSRGRPSSVFAPKSSRLARVLLQEPRQWLRQSELSRLTQLGAGYVSRICERLEEDHLIERSKAGVRPRDPGLLLDAWRVEYDFRRHEVRPGHVASRSGEELARRVVETCEDLRIPYALTGLAAAWLLAPFAGFRLVTVYLQQPPSDKLLQRLKWHGENRGANLWLVRANDEGIFHGGRSNQGMNCVSPVQAYLDLHGMPERAQEAAEHLRKELLQWQ
jgi:DNA-binding Lrp family transcriptional regulator